MRIDPVQSAGPAEVKAIEAAPAPRAAKAASAPVHNEVAAQMARESEPTGHALSIRLDTNKRVVYTVIDEKTGEVVRQSPPKEVLAAAHSVDAFLQAEEAKERRAVDITS